MSKMTGDLVQIGVAKETTRGTPIAPAYELRWGSLDFNDGVMQSVDESRSGILEDSRDIKVVGLFADGKVTAPVRDKSIGLFLASLFGTNTDTGPSDSAYTHTFTVAQNVQHSSLTFHRKDPNAGRDFALGMISKFELDIGTEKHAMFSADFRSKSQASATLGTFTVTIATPGVVTLASHGLVTGDAVIPSTTGALPTGLTAGTTYFVYKVDANTFNLCTTLANALAGTKITTSGSQSGTHTMTMAYRYLPAVPVTENIFLPQHVTFKLASTQSGLGAASAINVRAIKLKIESEVEDDRSLGSTAPTDIVNKGFSVKLEVTLVRSAETYVTALIAGTAYAARIDLNNTDALIGTSSTPRLYFDLNQVILQEAPTENSRGDLALITLNFKATYKEADSAMISAILVNSLATVA